MTETLSLRSASRFELGIFLCLEFVSDFEFPRRAVLRISNL